MKEESKVIREVGWRDEKRKKKRKCGKERKDGGRKNSKLPHKSGIQR